MASRFPWKTVAIGSVVLGVLVAATRGRRTQPVGRVALIGDSYAEGLGWELAKIFPDFKWEGHVGTRTDQWANHTGCGTCGDWLTEYKPDVVLVSLGANDGATPKLSNYQTIVRALQGIGARVVWIKPPVSVNLPARGAIDSLGVQTVSPTGAQLAADGIHPVSYAPWAQEIATAVTR